MSSDVQAGQSTNDVRRALIKRRKFMKNVLFEFFIFVIQVHWKGCNHQCVLTSVSVAIFLRKLDLGKIYHMLL